MEYIKKIMHDLKWKLMLPYIKPYIKKNSKIADIGAGDLYISKLMQDEFDSKVIGIDVADYGTKFVESVIIKDSKLPFPKNNFDYVTFIDSLHHIGIESQIKILKEAKRVGKSIILFEDAKSFMSYFWDILLNRVSMARPLTHKNVSEWLKLFKKLNFQAKYIKVKKPIWYPLRHYIFVIK